MGLCPKPRLKTFWKKVFRNFKNFRRKINEGPCTLFLRSAKLSMGPLPHLFAKGDDVGLCPKPRLKTFWKKV
jgi:hypothetical protein